MRQQTGASERRQYSDRQEQVSAGNRTTGRSRSAPAIQQAGADISASNRTTGRSRLAPAIQQPPGTGLLRRPPSVRRKKNRLSLTPPIQQHTGICQYTTPYHSAEQRRARKGGARGGKAGFVTPSAFPPRKPAHAKVSPRKGKSLTAQSVPPERERASLPKCLPPGKKLSVRRHRLSAQERPSDARHCTISGTIFSLFLSIIQLLVYYKEHTSKLLTLNLESVILWSS